MNNNYPYQNNLGYAYGVSRPQARNTQPLTPEQIAKLRQNSNAFDMKVEQEDLWRAACTHREKNGQPTLISNDDGTYTCTICHERFHMSEASTEEIKSAVDTLIDMLQTTKTLYVDAPDELIRQYFQMIPLLKKFPNLWERAVQNFSQYETVGFTAVNPMGPAYSGFNALQNLMSNPYPAYGGYGYQATQPPVQGYGYQPNNFYPQPIQAAPAYGAPVDPSVNPMAYGVPAPTAPAPGVMPVAAPAVPAAPVADPAAAAPAPAEVKQTQVFNV